MQCPLRYTTPGCSSGKGARRPGSSFRRGTILRGKEALGRALEEVEPVYEPAAWGGDEGAARAVGFFEEAVGREG